MDKSLNILTTTEVKDINLKLDKFLNPFGMESYSFLVNWYNSKVHEVFRLPYHNNTVSFTIISTPSMFEKAFMPFVVSQCIDHHLDPLDQCMRNILGNLKTLLQDFDIELTHDYELTPTRRPKILMQTAGHVCGAARFYQRSDLGAEDPWGKNEKVFGVSIHPVYGGWFAFRAVVVLKNCICENLEEKIPKMVICDKKDLIKLLNLFNKHWKDGRFRDIISTSSKYSDIQRLYFNTLPAERHEVIEKIIKSYKESLNTTLTI